MLSKLKTVPLRAWLISLVLAAAATLGVTMARAEGVSRAPVSRAEAEKIAPANPWSACYAGVSVGVAAIASDYGDGIDGYQYGGALGCDLQVGVLVIGAFADHQWQHLSVTGFNVDARSLTLGGRAGVLVNPSTLVYGKVGHVQLKAEGDSSNGIAIGGGIETMLRSDVTLALEYNRAIIDDLDSARFHTVGARLSYRFGVPGLNR